jgi:AcrR family transcriptional regulator
VAKRDKLSNAGIVSAALAMIDANGEKAFSMRKLAAALNVDPMAIYHHHANKAALMQAVLDAMLREFSPPATTGDWRQDLTALCHEFRALGHRHPGAFRMYEIFEDWITAEHRVHEAFRSTLRSAGFSRRVTVQATRMLVVYTEAFVVDEIGGWLGAEVREELEESLANGHFPVTSDLIEEIVAPDIEADFVFGLNVLLRGLEDELAAA